MVKLTMPNFFANGSAVAVTLCGSSSDGCFFNIHTPYKKMSKNGFNLNSLLLLKLILSHIESKYKYKNFIFTFRFTAGILN
jgi:hypothetical protein